MAILCCRVALIMDNGGTHILQHFIATTIKITIDKMQLMNVLFQI